MRKYVSLVLLAALALIVFAPAALAQQMEDNMMMEDSTMMEDNMMMDSASASASAMMMDSASASAMMTDSASASASAMMEDEMMSGSASASAMMGDDLPRTGGTPLLPLLSAAVLAVMVGSGLVAARLVRSHS